jgi:hypothetical protein
VSNKDKNNISSPIKNRRILAYNLQELGIVHPQQTKINPVVPKKNNSVLERQ